MAIDIEKLKKLADMKPPRDYGDMSPGEAYMGNYGDCYEAGYEDGERALAASIRNLIAESGGV